MKSMSELKWEIYDTNKQYYKKLIDTLLFAQQRSLNENAPRIRES
jgi:hypothetical protein